MLRSLLLLASALFAIQSSPAFGASTPITACGTVIKAPGDYHLATNLVCGSDASQFAGVRISQTSGVRLDLGGFRIARRGPALGSVFGILVDYSQNVEIYGIGAQLLGSDHSNAGSNVGIEITKSKNVTVHAGAGRASINITSFRNGLKVTGSEEVSVFGIDLLDQTDTGVFVGSSKSVKLRAIGISRNDSAFTPKGMFVNALENSSVEQVFISKAKVGLEVQKSKSSTFSGFEIYGVSESGAKFSGNASIQFTNSQISPKYNGILFGTENNTSIALNSVKVVPNTLAKELSICKKNHPSAPSLTNTSPSVVYNCPF